MPAPPRVPPRAAVPVPVRAVAASPRRWPLEDPSWTPRRVDVEPLLAVVVGQGGDADAARAALGRLDPPPVEAVAAALAGALAAPDQVPGAVALLRLLGRFAGQPEARDALLGALRDAEPRVRRAAAQALGRARPAGSADALAACFIQEHDHSVRRALVEALGKVGGAVAAQALAAAPPAAGPGAGAPVDDPELRRRLEVARLRLGRDARRVRGAGRVGSAPGQPPGGAAARLPPGTEAVYRCRAGLEGLLAEELGGGARPLTHGRVVVRVEGPLAALARPRLALAVTLPLQDEALDDGRDPVEALAAALAVPRARALLALHGGPPARFRIAWAEGKQRAATHAVAAALAPHADVLVNDPRGSDWEVHARSSRERLHVALEPRGLLEARFAWRTAEVPGASHPTVAAALALVGEPRRGDRVWDPFVGSALELCECFLLEPGAELWGTDLDPRALAAARANLDAVGGWRGAVPRVTLLGGDATTLPLPARPTLVVTNPPWGRRVSDAASAASAVRGVLARVGRELSPGGRMVWIAREPRQSDAWVSEAGLVVSQRWPLDLGGIHGELQRLTRGAGRATPDTGRGTGR